MPRTGRDPPAAQARADCRQRGYAQGRGTGSRRGGRARLAGVSCGHVTIVRLLDQLPEAICQSPEQLWSVLARSLGEQGADGRTALAWRWALNGTSPSPVALSQQPGRPPGRAELITEAEAPAELSYSAADPGGQVMHARFVLSRLAGDLDALPLWNGRPGDLHVTDGAACPRTAAEIERSAPGRCWCSGAIPGQGSPPRPTRAR
jgi:hypothetical protein